jgi:stalled ribosome rescue protein Dom34
MCPDTILIKDCIAMAYGKGKRSVTNVKRKKGYRRGHSVALLVGFEADHAVLWHIFSHVVKLQLRLELGARRTDERALYTFHESVVDALRPMLKEGVRSIVVTAPMKTSYAADFLSHVRKHHMYLIQSKGPDRATFAELIGSADQLHSVAELVKTKEFRRLVAETTSGEAGYIVDILEKHLSGINSNSVTLFSLKEIEDAIYNREKDNDFEAAHLMLTDEYLAGSEDKNRIHRLLQISKNRKVKTRIVNAETRAGKRISQFGGIIFFAIPLKQSAR